MDDKSIELIKAADTQADAGLAQDAEKHIQLRLWQLLAARMERYNMGESSSVRIEVAEELMKSILFTLSYYQESIGSDLAHLDPREDFGGLFERGLAELSRLLAEGKQMLANIPEELMPIPNLAYQSISSDLGGFFLTYDVYYFAHETPGLDGYPLYLPVTELRGILYVNEYLRLFQVENRFCRCFAMDAILPLLRSHCPDLKNGVCNFFEHLFACAMALCLLGKDPLSLSITGTDRELLADKISIWSDEECAERFRDEMLRLGRVLDLREEREIEYLLEAARVFAIQARAYRDKLEFLLPSPWDENTPVPEPFFLNEKCMDNEKLRKLIIELGGIPVRERIQRVKNEVRSVRDLMEVLGNCFWGDECPAYFAELDAMETAVLLYACFSKKSLFPDWSSQSGWETELQDYVRGLSQEKAGEIMKNFKALESRPVL